MKCLEPTDKVKTCLEILLDAQMDVRGYLNETDETGKPAKRSVILVQTHGTAAIFVQVYQSKKIVYIPAI